MKNMKSCGGNWLIDKSYIDKRVGVPSRYMKDMHSFFFAALFLPIFFCTLLSSLVLNYFCSCHLCTWSATRVHKF